MSRALNLLVTLFRPFFGETSNPWRRLDNEPGDRCNYRDSSDFGGGDVQGDGHEDSHNREMSEGDLCEKWRTVNGNEYLEGRDLDYHGGDELRKCGYPMACDEDIRNS